MATDIRPRELYLNMAACDEPSSSTDRTFIVIDDDSVEEEKDAQVSKNTLKATSWAVGVFNHWLREHNETAEEKCPPDILLCTDAASLCRWLCVFVEEVRKYDGQEYEAKSIGQILMGLQRYINTSGKTSEDQPDVRFCDPNCREYKELHQSLDRRCKDLQSKNTGIKRKSEILSHSEEALLWDTGVMGVDNPSALLNAVFFYNGLNFAISSGAEHRHLKISQLTFKDAIPDPNVQGRLVSCVEYARDSSKRQYGGQLQLNVANKVVQYACPELGERCHVSLLKLYLSKLPPGAIEKDIFYWKPSTKRFLAQGEPWFMNNVLGHNTLDKRLRAMLSDAGINSTNKTTRSLRATAITRMMVGNITSSIAMDRPIQIPKSSLLKPVCMGGLVHHVSNAASTDSISKCRPTDQSEHHSNDIGHCSGNSVSDAVLTVANNNGTTSSNGTTTVTVHDSSSNSPTSSNATTSHSYAQPRHHLQVSPRPVQQIRVPSVTPSTDSDDQESSGTKDQSDIRPVVTLDFTEVLNGMKYHGLHGCTINISFQTN